MTLIVLNNKFWLNTRNAIRPTFGLIALLLLGYCLSACRPNYRKATDCVTRLEDTYQDLMAQFHQAELTFALHRDSKTYYSQLKRLQKRQKRLYRSVRDCDVEDRQAYNRWYRSRLKFPSPIDQALTDLANRS